MRHQNVMRKVLTSRWLLFFYQPSSVHGWTLAFLLAVHRWCGVVEGRLSHFLPHWLRMGWQSAISQGKIPWNTPPWLGIEPGPRGGQTVSYPTELSWLNWLCYDIYNWSHLLHISTVPVDHTMMFIISSFIHTCLLHKNTSELTVN